MKLEDRFMGECSGVKPFDIELFVEQNLMAKDANVDPRNFVYEQRVIRPRHIIMLYECINTLSMTNEIYSVTGPAFLFDGVNLSVNSYRSPTFEDLLKHLEDAALQNRYLFLYSVETIRIIDPISFVPTSGFICRFGKHN